MQPASKPENTRLLDQARELVTQLESGNTTDADRLIDELGRQREQVLFLELGKMTRQLHDALNGFAVDSRIVSMAESEIPDAKARLNHVIAMTEDSANRTLAAVEEAFPVAAELQQQANILHEKWSRFRCKEMSVEEFRSVSREIDTFLDASKEHAGIIHAKLSDVMMAQEFQDITGQIISRVITLVQEVEDNLVGLVRLSGQSYKSQETSVAGAAAKGNQEKDMMQGLGPQVPGTDDTGGSVSGQDEVDDLLSSLGF